MPHSKKPRQEVKATNTMVRYVCLGFQKFDIFLHNTILSQREEILVVRKNAFNDEELYIFEADELFYYEEPKHWRYNAIQRLSMIDEETWELYKMEDGEILGDYVVDRLEFFV
jgi:hypothetical protein